MVDTEHDFPMDFGFVATHYQAVTVRTGQFIGS